ncbi:MAG: histidine phosphatase family protein [Armatimonadetes bacterium]|nr:histidine phosphatase family protein [Armatimonadota bacterium]
MRLFLIRHGQTAWNKDGRAQGHTDIGLDDIGLEQTEQLALSFSGIEIDRVFSSDLLRCVQTASGIARTGVEQSAIFRERSFGTWEGEPYQEIHHRLRDAAAKLGVSEFNARPDGGESVMDVWDRLEPAVAEIEDSHGNTVIVTHGGTCALLLCQFLRTSVDTSRSFRFPNTAVTELERRPDGFWSLVRFADTSHLARPSAPMIDAQNLATR